MIRALDPRCRSHVRSLWIKHVSSAWVRPVLSVCISDSKSTLALVGPRGACPFERALYYTPDDSAGYLLVAQAIGWDGGLISKMRETAKQQTASRRA